MIHELKKTDFMNSFTTENDFNIKSLNAFQNNQVSNALSNIRKQKKKYKSQKIDVKN